MKVGYTVADVGCEVGDLSAASRVAEMIVDPSQQNLFRGELEQILKCLTLFKQKYESWMMCNVDITQQTNLKDNRDDKNKFKSTLTL